MRGTSRFGRREASAGMISESEARGNSTGPDGTNEAVSRGTIARMSLQCVRQDKEKAQIKRTLIDPPSLL